MNNEEVSQPKQQTDRETAALEEQMYLERHQMQMMQRPPFDPLVMYGSIKVVDGLFITDEIAAHVRMI